MSCQVLKIPTLMTRLLVCMVPMILLADVDTKDGTAITSAADMDGFTAGISKADGQPVAAGGFTPPQQGNIQVQSIFDDGIVMESGGDYGPTNAYYAGAVTDVAPIFFWTGGGIETNELGSGNLVGYNSDASNGKALQITGKGSLPTSPAFALTNWTVCMWIYPEATPSGDAFCEIQTGAPALKLLCDVSGSNLRFWLNGVSDSSITLPVVSNWTHMAWVYDYDAATPHGVLYIDGSPVGTNNTTFVLENAYIGIARRLAGAYGLKAKYDDIYIWDVALSSSEVTTMVNQGDPSTRSE